MFFSLSSLLVLLFCSISCSALGSFVIWKRLSFFGDAMSHSALFGVAIAIYFQTEQIFTLIIFNIIFAIISYIASKQKLFAIDSVVMIVAYFFIACAVLFNESFNSGFELEEFVFGDVLKSNYYHVAIIFSLCVAIIIFTLIYWQKFLVIVMNPDVASVKGVKSDLINLYFMILLSLLIAFSINIVGVLLVTALMILPSSIARIISNNPQQMIIRSVVIAIVITILCSYFAVSFSFSIVPFIIFILAITFFIFLTIKNIHK